MIGNKVGIALEIIKRLIVTLLRFAVQNVQFGFSVYTFLEAL